MYLLAHLTVNLTPCTAILPAVLFLPIVLVDVLSICNCFSLSSLSDLESVVSEMSTIGIVCTSYCDSDIMHCHITVPAVLLLFLPAVLVVVLSKCDSLSLSSMSDVESVVKIGLVILLGCLVIFK